MLTSENEWCKIMKDAKTYWSVGMAQRKKGKGSYDVSGGGLFGKRALLTSRESFVCKFCERNYLEFGNYWEEGEKFGG